MHSTPHDSAELDRPTIAVIGAGIVGVCCALALRRSGYRVCVFDEHGPQHGTSYGNAGHMATEQVFPVADAAILRQLPRMLMDPTGPLRLDWRHLPKATPWFIKALLNLRAQPFQESVDGLRALNERSLAAWQRLLDSTGDRSLLKTDGSLLVFEHAESRDAIAALQTRMQTHGVPVDRWSAEQITRQAPALSDTIQGGLFFPATGHCINPQHLVDALVAAAEREGVVFNRERVIGSQLEATGVQLTTNSQQLHVDKMLICCGAFSAPLVHELTGVRVPLDTERGYHLMLANEHGRLPFSVTSFERRFIMTPMNTGLRLAGTVEFAGLRRPANMKRAWQLHTLTDGLFKKPLSRDEATPWMGFRPSLPDSLPVIDQAMNGRVLLAFGHHHLGLTQAAITAEMITTLAQPVESTPSDHRNNLPSLAPYQLARFA